MRDGLQLLPVLLCSLRGETALFKWKRKANGAPHSLSCFAFACGTPVSWHCGERLLNQVNPFPFVSQNRSNLRGRGKRKLDNWGGVDNLLGKGSIFKPVGRFQGQEQSNALKRPSALSIKMDWTPKMDPFTPMPGYKIERRQLVPRTTPKLRKNSLRIPEALACVLAFLTSVSKDLIIQRKASDR